MEKENKLGIVNVYPKHNTAEVPIKKWVNVFKNMHPESKNWNIDIKLLGTNPIDIAAGEYYLKNNLLTIYLNFFEPITYKVLLHELLHRIMGKYSNRGAGVFDYSKVDLHYLTKEKIRSLYTSFEDWFIEVEIYNYLHSIKNDEKFFQSFYRGTFNKYTLDLKKDDLSNYANRDFMFYIEQLICDIDKQNSIPPYSLWAAFHSCLSRGVNGFPRYKSLSKLSPLEKKLMEVLQDYSDLEKLDKDYYKMLFCDFFNTTTNYFFGYNVVKPNKSKIQLLETFGNRVKWIDQGLKENK